MGTTKKNTHESSTEISPSPSSHIIIMNGKVARSFTLGGSHTPMYPYNNLFIGYKYLCFEDQPMWVLGAYGTSDSYFTEFTKFKDQLSDNMEKKKVIFMKKIESKTDDTKAWHKKFTGLLTSTYCFLHPHVDDNFVIILKVFVSSPLIQVVVFVLLLFWFLTNFKSLVQQTNIYF